MKRVFIAVNLPFEIKEELEGYKKEIKGLFVRDPVKWVEKDCLHITLAFIGAIREDNLHRLEKELEAIKEKSFSVFLNEISYIPPEKRQARMIWAKGESKGLQALQKKIEETLVASPCVNYSPDKRGFTVHITLGRIRKWDWQRIPLSRIPDIGREVNLNFKVDSFELMESKLKREGPQYETIVKYELS